MPALPMPARAPYPLSWNNFVSDCVAVPCSPASKRRHFPIVNEARPMTRRQLKDWGQKELTPLPFAGRNMANRGAFQGFLMGF